MASPLEQGTVSRYLEERGFGFIARPGMPELFFRIGHCICSRPYVDEVVLFEIGKDRDGREEARSVCRPAGDPVSGDVIEWAVDPATRRGTGSIAPKDGGDILPFSGADIAPALGTRSVNPRPWHAARYRAITLGGRTTAVDIQIDWRYPLQRFAYLGNEPDLISQLRGLALEEDWDYRNSESRKPHEILYNYLHFTFAKLVDEDRGCASADRKIRIRTDIKDHDPLATFNTGLVDNRYESIFALLERNDAGRQPMWKFLAFCTPGEDAGKLLSRYFNPLPAPARYFSHASELLYDPDAALHPDYRHILSENRDRLPQDLLKSIAHMDATKAEKTLKMHVDRAIDLARKRARWNFKTAIPHYFPTHKRLDFLLPLCLLDDSTVDGALAVQRTETGYLGNTILPLDWAYKSARLVCRPDSDWLAPKKIDAGDAAEFEQ